MRWIFSVHITHCQIFYSRLIGEQSSFYPGLKVKRPPLQSHGRTLLITGERINTGSLLLLFYYVVQYMRSLFPDPYGYSTATYVVSVTASFLLEESTTPW
jgi:hypothetical protein